MWDKVNSALRRTGFREIGKCPNEIIGRLEQGTDENYILAETSYVLWIMRCREYWDDEKASLQFGIIMLKNRLNLRCYIDLKLGRGRKWEKLQHFIKNLDIT